MGRYILGVKVSECNDKTKKRCLVRLEYAKCNIYKCHAIMKLNPLCMCKNLSHCRGSYTIIKHKKDMYILYNCHNRCNHFIKNYEKAIEMIVKPLEDEDIYYGDDLKILIKKISKGKELNVDYLDKYLNELETVFNCIDFGVGDEL